MLDVRQLLPPLTIRTPDGRTVRAWDYKQKKNLAVAFLDNDCPSCVRYLQRIAKNIDRFRAANSVVIAVFLGFPPAGLADDFPPEIIVGSDPSGRAALSFLGNDSLLSGALRLRGIFVTDRYGALVFQWSVSGHEFPPPNDILRALEQIEISCEECFPPDS